MKRKDYFWKYPAYDLNANEIYDYAKVVGVATINLW